MTRWVMAQDNNDQYTYDTQVISARKADHPIHPLLLSRTSPRAMNGEAITDSELLPIFEAARWTSSFYNQQPWRYLYARKGTEYYQKLWDLLWQLNQGWCDKASVLIVAVSKKHFTYEGKEQEMPTYSFDVGAASFAMHLEANARGYVFHAMAGFDYEKAYEVLGVPKDTHKVEAMFAIGKRDDTKPERIAERRPVDQFVFEGDFNNNLK